MGQTYQLNLFVIRDVTDFKSVGFRRFFTNPNLTDLQTHFLSDSNFILNEQRLPLLASVARTYLATSLSIIQGERIFSSVADIVDEHHTRMTAENAEQLIFLKSNLPLWQIEFFRVTTLQAMWNSLTIPWHFPDSSRHSSAALDMLNVTNIMPVLVLLSVVGVEMQQCMIRNHLFNI